jgi:hypothetical protein
MTTATTALTAKGQKVVAELTEAWHAVNRELAAAPAWKIGTAWWNDREHELAHLERRLNLLGVLTW